jgi:hypothetical protein
LTDRGSGCYCFSESKAKSLLALLIGAGRTRGFRRQQSALAIRANRKGGQVIENKQFREMPRFRTPMISMTYDRRGETIRFAWRNRPFSLACFFRFPKRKMAAKSTAASGLGRWALRG